MPEDRAQEAHIELLVPFVVSGTYYGGGSIGLLHGGRYSRGARVIAQGLAATEPATRDHFTDGCV